MTLRPGTRPRSWWTNRRPSWCPAPGTPEPQRLAADRDRGARVGGVVAGQHLDERRLARAVLAERGRGSRPLARRGRRRRVPAGPGRSWTARGPRARCPARPPVAPPANRGTVGGGGGRHDRLRRHETPHSARKRSWKPSGPGQPLASVSRSSSATARRRRRPRSAAPTPRASQLGIPDAGCVAGHLVGQDPHGVLVGHGGPGAVGAVDDLLQLRCPRSACRRALRPSSSAGAVERVGDADRQVGEREPDVVDVGVALEVGGDLLRHLAGAEVVDGHRQRRRGSSRGTVRRTPP